jgi:hypothetical protein
MEDTHGNCGCGATAETDRSRAILPEDADEEARLLIIPIMLRSTNRAAQQRPLKSAKERRKERRMQQAAAESKARMAAALNGTHGAATRAVDRALGEGNFGVRTSTRRSTKRSPLAQTTRTIPAISSSSGGSQYRAVDVLSPLVQFAERNSAAGDEVACHVAAAAAAANAVGNGANPFFEQPQDQQTTAPFTNNHRAGASFKQGANRMHKRSVSEAPASLAMHTRSVSEAPARLIPMMI